MSAWSVQPLRLFPERSLAPLGMPSGGAKGRGPLWLGLLCAVLVLQGLAITQSILWAAPLICLLVIAVAVEIPVIPLIGLLLLVRVLTDHTGSTTSRHSASVNIAVLIAGLLILVAIGLAMRRQRGITAAAAIAVWLCIWTAVAALSDGGSVVSVREGVREASILAVGLIAYNSSRELRISTVTRLVQVVGFIPAVLAIYQLGTHTGMLINEEVRANGTFSHPNSAALFFALAVIVSLWRFLSEGRHRIDAILGLVFGVATIATYSLGGLASLLAMLLAIGLLQRGGIGVKFGAWATAAILIMAFLASPLGAERIASESSTSLGNYSYHASSASHSSLAWRLYKWKTLIPEWEKSPVLGQGLGTTVTAEGTAENRTAEILPHSEYVRYLVETGALGLITLICGVFLLFRRLRRRRFTPDGRDVGKLGIAITVGFLVNAFAANTLLYTPAAYAAALILGCVLGAAAAEVGPNQVSGHDASV
jgi:O-antigen ligase